jgi:hypothetical protein
MRHDLHAETGSRLGQIRDLERELAELHGYRRAPHGAGLDCLDPSTGERISLGAVVSRLRREHREARGRAEAGRAFPRDEPGQGHEQAGEQRGGVHEPTVAQGPAAKELAP